MVNKKIFILLSIVSIMFFSTSCKKEDNNNSNNIIDTSNTINDNNNSISNNENKKDHTLINDVASISKEENNTMSFIISSDDGGESSTKELYLEKLTFGEWGFEISIPKGFIEEYEVIDNMSKLNIANVDDMSKSYVISNDDTLQIFNLDDKYFGVFIDNELYNENWEKAIDEGLYDYIKQIIPNNSFYLYQENVSPYKEIYGDNAILIRFPINITPTSDETLIYDGYIGYLTIDNMVYYIIYGENTIYNSSMKDSGYKDIVFSSIDVLDTFIKNNTNEEQKDDNIDYELLNKLEEELDKEISKTITNN